MLHATEIQRLSKDEKLSYSTSIWGFLRSKETGAPFALNMNQAIHQDDPEAETARQCNPSGEAIKYLSLNKVEVNIDGESNDKLVVMRDLSSMVKVQKQAKSKQQMNTFMSKIV